jgi:glycosyltransferase involved in cell wall biosynthesis
VRRFQRLRQVARALEYPLDWIALLQRIRARRPDVVHIQWPMLPPVDLLGFLAIKRLSVRLVYTVHDVRPHYEGWRRTWLSTRPLYGLADALIVHTETNRRDLCAATGLPASRVHTIAQGSETEWAAPAVDRETARAGLRLPADAPLLLFFGIIKPYKRLDLLLETFPLVLRKVPTARLLIVGRAAEPFGRYQRIIDQLGLGDRVIQQVRYVSEEEKAGYFCAADVVVLPYTDADFSGVLLAAYLFGRPVVATETGGLGEMIEEGVTGHLVPPNDRRALADALVRLLVEPERAARLGQGARLAAQTKHDWSASAHATLRLYEEVRDRR